MPPVASGHCQAPSTAANAAATAAAAVPLLAQPIEYLPTAHFRVAPYQ